MLSVAHPREPAAGSIRWSGGAVHDHEGGASGGMPSSRARRLRMRTERSEGGRRRLSTDTDATGPSNALSQKRRFLARASMLRRPDPLDAIYRKTKQYRTASSPLLTIGQNPPGACAMK